jgi:probable phosphoglycerate mutase
MTKVYLIRHAEAEGNLYRRVHGQYDGLITEMGNRQIEALEKRFEDIGVDAVYSSDLTRARSTAAAVYKPKNLKLNLNPALRELNVGEWEDRAWGDLRWREPEQMRNFGSDPANFSVRGSEDFYDLQARVTEAILRAAHENDGASVAVVSHGMAIRAFICGVTGIKSEEISKIPPADNTAVTALNVDGDKIEIEYLGDNSHLPPELTSYSSQDWWRTSNIKVGNDLRYVPLDFKTDAGRYLDYRRDAWETIHGSLQGFSDEFLELAVERAKEDPWAVSLAMLQDRPAGLIELAPERDKRDNAGCIALYYMEKPYRGSGLAVQLLGQAVSIYRKLGRDKLRLSVAEENERAKKFYRKHGFEKKGEADGAVGKLYLLEKDISLASQKYL